MAAYETNVHLIDLVMEHPEYIHYKVFAWDSDEDNAELYYVTTVREMLDAYPLEVVSFVSEDDSELWIADYLYNFDFSFFEEE